MKRLIPLAALLLASCAQTGQKVTPAFFENPPRSILVLPPLDLSLETGATYGTYASVARPLVELGYYVFPPAVVDRMMRENGLPTPVEMHEVPIDRLVDIFDPDAVLYLQVTDWGTSFQLIQSVTRIALDARLVDADTGAELWQDTHTVQLGSGQLGGGLVGLVAGAVASQVARSANDPSREIAREANWQLFGPAQSSLVVGPYHPDHAEQFQAAADRNQSP